MSTQKWLSWRDWKDRPVELLTGDQFDTKINVRREWYSLPISDLFAGVRLWNVLLTRLGREATMYDLAQLTYRDLLRQKHCGRKTINELNHLLCSFCAFCCWELSQHSWNCPARTTGDPPKAWDQCQDGRHGIFIERDGSAHELLCACGLVRINLAAEQATNIHVGDKLEICLLYAVTKEVSA